MEGEEQIIRRARHGDLRAFHELIEAHGQYAYRVAYGLLGSAADAEDAVQETFLAAFKSIGRYEARSSFRTWLIGILTRQAALVRRKRPRMRLVSDQAGTGSETAASDAQMDIAGVLQQLPEEQRQVLVLRELQHMSYDEIATTLGIPKGTVESRLYRARAQLKLRLSGYEDGSRT